MVKRKVKAKPEKFTVRPLTYNEALIAVRDDFKDFSLRQSVNAAVDRYSDLVICFEGPHLFAYHVAELEVLISMADSLFTKASDSEKQEIQNLKVGVARCPVLTLLRAVRDILHHVRIDQPIEASSIRELMESVGIPSKPYEVLAIWDEIENYFSSNNREHDDWMAIRNDHLAFAKTKRNDLLRECPDKIRRTEQRDIVEIRKSMFSVWVKPVFQKNYMPSVL